MNRESRVANPEGPRTRNQRWHGPGIRGPLIVGVFAIAAAALLALVTHWGIGVTPDSVTYLEAARNLLQGRGFVETVPETGEDLPVTRYPPAYPALIAAAASATGLAPLEAARWLAVVLFAANVALAGGLAFHYTAFHTTRSLPATALMSLLTASSPLMLELHSAAWSEPPFLFFGWAWQVWPCIYKGAGECSWPLERSPSDWPA